MDLKFKHVEGCGELPNKVETIWDKVLKLMIALKASDNINEITAGVAKVHNDAAVTETIAEYDSDVIFLSNLNLIGTNINNNNNGILEENEIEGVS